MHLLVSQIKLDTPSAVYIPYPTDCSSSSLLPQLQQNLTRIKEHEAEMRRQELYLRAALLGLLVLVVLLIGLLVKKSRW